MSLNVAIRAKFMRYNPLMIEAMTAVDSKVLHRLRRVYQEPCLTIAEYKYVCAMSKCVIEKLSTFDCMCPDCFIVWNVLDNETLERLQYVF